MKVLPLTLGPIVGETTPARVRLWGQAAYEATPEGPRRACGVARIRSVTGGGGFSDPLFLKMNPNSHDGCCDFFVTDVRTERLFGEEGENLRIVSAAQIEALKSWLVDGSSRVKLVATSVPVFSEVRGKIHDHWSGFPLDRAELLRFIAENGCERVVFLSGDVHASVSAELRAAGGSEAKLVSIVSSPFLWPYPRGPAGLFRLEGTIRAGDLTFELAEAGPVQSADNFTRVTVHPDRVEAELFSRKGLPLGPSKVHRF